MSDRLAALAHRTYASAKGCPEKQVLPWDAPPGGQGLPDVHKLAWVVVSTGILGWLKDPEDDDEEDAIRHAWEVYVQEINATAFAIRWERASDEHKAAWRAVVAALREEAKAWG